MLLPSGRLRAENFVMHDSVLVFPALCCHPFSEFLKSYAYHNYGEMVQCTSRKLGHYHITPPLKNNDIFIILTGVVSFQMPT
jgi:hypothetical protein